LQNKLKKHWGGHQHSRVT